MPPGTQCPSTVSPPGGTERGGPDATGGWALSVSSMHALRYGNEVMALKVMSSSFAKEERISDVSFS